MNWKLLTTVMMAVLATHLILSYSAITVDLLPNNATTLDDLVCTWDVQGTFDQINVTWYNNSQLVVERVGVGGTSNTLKYQNTTRGEVWNCTVNIAEGATNDVVSDKVQIQNSLPEPPNLGNRTILEDDSYSETVTSNDADGDPVSFLCDTNPFDTCNSGGLIEWQPGQSDVGAFNFTIYARDNYEPFKLIGTQVVYTVQEVNDPPSFSPALANQSIFENSTLQYGITVADEENNTGPFGFSVESDYNPERIEYNSSDNKTFVIQFVGNRKANFSDRGNHTINVTACDPENGSICTSGLFNLEVIPINQRPELGPIPNQSGTQGASFELYVNATDRDISDTLTFSVSSPGCALPNPWSIVTEDSSSNATGLINVTALNNSHIACRNITVSVQDSVGQTDEQKVYLDLTNINDAPTLYNLSFSNQNTNNNTDMRNITAFTNLTLRYKVNGSDPDLFTYESEVLTYTDNSSLCVDCPLLNMDSATGLVNFTPTDTEIGSFRYEINVTDDDGLAASGVLVITVVNNTAPYFNPALENQTVNESDLLIYDINATDDQGDEITYVDNSTLFVISQQGLINFTPACTDRGNYSVKISISDQVGAEQEGVFYLEIVNEPDAPVLPLVRNASTLEELPYSLDVGSYTTDADVTCGITDDVTYSSSFIVGSELFSINSSTGVISYTPTTSDQGNYLIEINATDTFGLYDTLRYNLTIYNRTAPPVIHNITPYDTPTVFGWTDTSGSNSTSIRVSENSTTVYDHNSTDPDNDPLYFNWTVDGVVVGHEKNLSHYWDFSSSGWRTVRLTVSDNVSGILAHRIPFTWNTNVTPFNRRPLFNESLPNVTMNGSALQYTDYLTGQGARVSFNDPDDDQLSYNHTPVSVVTITYSGDTVTFTPVSIGTDTVIFTGSDGEYSVDSNNVTIMVLDIDIQESQTVTSTSSSSSSSDSPVPYSVTEEVEVEKQVYLDIIVPTTLTVYRNNTARQLIRIVNTGNFSIRGISLGAETNSTDADITFSTSHIPELAPGEETKTDMVVTAYQLLNKFEVIIWANVSDPEYRDKAVVYVNAIEKTRGNESVASTKITFARDLLSSNPECIELNEFLRQAQQAMQQQDYERASSILDSVIQGCKYLVSQGKLRDEQPTGLVLGVDFDSIPYLKPALAAFAVLMVAAVAITIRARKANEGAA